MIIMFMDRNGIILTHPVQTGRIVNVATAMQSVRAFASHAEGSVYESLPGYSLKNSDSSTAK